MAEDVDYKLDMKKVGILAAGISILAVGTYLFFDYTKPTNAQKEAWKIWEEKNTSEYRHSLLEKTYVKADTNRDGALQVKEISSILSKVGLPSVIPETAPVSLWCLPDISKSYIDYNAGFSGNIIDINFSREDLEKYLES